MDKEEAGAAARDKPPAPPPPDLPRDTTAAGKIEEEIKRPGSGAEQPNQSGSGKSGDVGGTSPDAIVVASPSQLAREAQESLPKYGHADDWSDQELSEGTALWVATPERSEFAIPDADLDAFEDDARSLFTSVQVGSRRPPSGGEGELYRGQLEKYEVVGEPIPVAFAFDCTANAQHGEGGRSQLFVPDIEEHIDSGRLRLVETRDLYRNRVGPN